MAQRQLKKVFQTRKINSLPKDLRKIADELLIEKFGEDDTVKEVRKKSSSSFPGAIDISQFQQGIDMGYFGSSESVARFNDATDISNVYSGRGFDRPGISTRLDISSRTRVATTPVTSPDFRGLVEALRRLDEQNLPRRDRIFRLEPRFWNYFRQDRELGLYLSTNSYASEYILMGCRIIIDPSQSNELEVRF